MTEPAATDPTPIQKDTRYERQFVRNMVESSLRIGLIFILLVFTYDIIKPFVVPLTWGGIIAIATFPLTRRVEGWLGARRGLASTLVTLFFIALLVTPCYLLMDSMVEALRTLSTGIESGTLDVPEPPDRVADWPLVGEKLHALWAAANANLEALLTEIQPQLKELASRAMASAGRGLMGVLMFIISLIIAGAFMTYAEPCAAMTNRVFVRLGGEVPGGEWADLCKATVRSVLQGVVGVAVIQTILCAIGLFVMGIPLAAIWCAVILFLAIAQLPGIIVVGPIIVYAYSAYDPTPATIFTVYMLLAGFADTPLKALLMGRGLDIPMPVILIGAVGGMVASGIIGLFAGAVILSIWYKLFLAWLEQQAG